MSLLNKQLLYNSLTIDTKTNFANYLAYQLTEMYNLLMWNRLYTFAFLFLRNSYYQALCKQRNNRLYGDQSFFPLPLWKRSDNVGKQVCYEPTSVNFLPMSPKFLKTFPNEVISSLITRNALIFVIDFFNHKQQTLKN